MAFGRRYGLQPMFRSLTRGAQMGLLHGRATSCLTIRAFEREFMSHSLIAAFLMLMAAGDALAQDSLPAMAPARQVGGVEIPGDCALAKKEHPRLLFTRADIPRLRERLKHPRLAAELEHAKKMAADKQASGILLGVLYYLTDDPLYLAQAREKFTIDSQPESALLADLIMGAGDAAEQQKLADQLVAVVKKERYRPHVVHDLAAWGHGHDQWIDTDLRERYRSDMMDVIRSNNAWSMGRGGSSMGHGYNGEHFYSRELSAAVAWTTATGQDIIGQCDFAAHSPEWYVYHYRPWTAQPEVEHIGVTSMCGHWEATTPAKHEGENMAVLAVTRFGDGLGQWWVDEVISKVRMGWRADRDGCGGVWGKLLWYDPELPAAPLATLPPARLFPENGHAIMRSDWSKDATFALFRCGRFGTIDGYWGRNNADNLSFIITKNGFLAPDTGGVHRGNSHATQMVGRQMDDPPNASEYARQTIAHNSILVGDQPLHVNHPGNYGLNKGEIVRDGGQCVYQDDKWWAAWGLTKPAREEEGRRPPFKPGTMVAYETSPLYDYAAGDATYSYPPGRVKSITRQFAYLRPDTFIVFDRVVKSDPRLPTRWLLHSMYEPEWNGRKVADDSLPADQQFAIAEDGKTRIANPNPGGRYMLSGGDLLTIDDRYAGMTGRLFARVLLPAADQRNLRLIGGPWHDFEVEGVNYGPTEKTYGPKTGANDPANRESSLAIEGWRVELSPKAAGADANFLVVMHAAEQKQAQMPAVESITADGQTGAKVTIGDKVYEVTFVTSGPVGGHIKLTQGQKTLLDQYLAGKVEDNYGKWSSDPNYKTWMTRPEYKNFIGAKEVDAYKP